MSAQRPQNYGLDKYDLPPEFAKHQHYLNPLRAKISVYNNTGADLLWEYDMFDDNIIDNPIKVLPFDVSLGATSTGSTVLNFLDLEKTINPYEYIRNNIITIMAKKYESDPWEPMITCYQNEYAPWRRKTYLEHQLVCLGKPYIFGNRLINVKKVARKADILASRAFDQTFVTREVIKDLLGNADNYLNSETSIAEDAMLDLTPLDTSEVTTELYGIHEPFSELRQGINNILDLTGSELLISEKANEDGYYPVYLKNIKHEHSQITVKSWEYANRDDNKDLALRTSYFFEDWQPKFSWSKESGFRNRLFAQGKSFNKMASSDSSDVAGSINLVEKDIAFSFVNTESSLRDLVIICNIVGAGTSSPSTTKNLHGHIVEDDNGTPTGRIVGYIEVPLKSLPKEPAPVHIAEFTKTQEVQPNQVYWVIFYYRGVNDDDTVNLYYAKTKEGTTKPMATRSHEDKSAPWAKRHFNNDGWNVGQQEFEIIYSVFDRFEHILWDERLLSMKRFGVVEDFIPTEFAIDAVMASRYLSGLLDITSLPKLAISTSQASIPRLFPLGQTIAVNDSLIKLNRNNTALTLDSVNYSFGGDHNLGAVMCSLTLLGNYNFMNEHTLKSKDLC